MSEIMKIGEYQLRNLIESRTPFLYLDLRTVNESDHELLAGSIKINPQDVLATVRAKGVATDGPIILICETGTVSTAAAIELSENSYINVFVIAGGLEALS